MTLPANAARALEQVKLGLAILYGANYFTDDEWTTISALVGIDQPKPAPGRPHHILDEPLISFSDAHTAVHDTVSTKDGTALHLELNPGSILIAQCNLTQKGRVLMGVSIGDEIRVIKKVSGMMYLGENLQTKQFGQIPDLIFQKSISAYRWDFSAEKPRTVASPKTFASVNDSSLNSSSAVLNLDEIEGTNAAEWEKDDASVVTAALSLSRHELLDVEDSTHTSLADEGQQPEEGGEMRAMLWGIQKVGSKAASSQPLPSHHAKTRNAWTESLKPVTPKTNICWFYATPNKECRFTAEECRDLHESYSSTTGSSSLYMGKPTWGALADLSPPLSSTESVDDPKGRTKTCWYWANGSCSNTAETCRFLHEQVPEGVMPNPNKWRRQQPSESVSGETDEGQNDATTDFARQKRVESAWTDSSVARYKPPHLNSWED